MTPTNRCRVAAELTAAADAYRTAVDGPSAIAEAEAAARWRRALDAATALLRADPSADAPRPPALRPGDRVLWLSHTPAAHGEQLDIQPGTIRAEAQPHTAAPAARRYLVELDATEALASTTRLAFAEDLIHTPNITAEEERRAG